MPLLEIVSEPDMRTGVEAAAYAAELRRIMVFFGITDGNMQACVVITSSVCWIYSMTVKGSGMHELQDMHGLQSQAFIALLACILTFRPRISACFQRFASAAGWIDPVRRECVGAARGAQALRHQGGGEEHELLLGHAKGD